MPYINQPYSSSASFSPSNATGVSYYWLIPSGQGSITSGQTSSTVNYFFSTVGQKTLTLTVFNQCSSVDFTKVFNVCMPIADLTVFKQDSSATIVGSNHQYYLNVGQGAPTTITWSIEGPGVIVGDPYSGSVTIQITGTGTITLLATVTDCEGAVYTTGKEITGTTTPPSPAPSPATPPPTACIPLVSCTF